MKLLNQLIATGLLWLFAVSAFCPIARGQTDMRHFRHSADMPPGMVGRDQLKQGGPLRGYFQPVQLIGPPGSSISIVVNGQFQPPEESPVTVGMLIGEVYRFKLSGIPGREGFEVFPTVEIINRLYPPPGKKVQFPIPIQLTTEELSLALDGLFVTRVIYLEDPAIAFPFPDDPQLQRYFEVARHQDPLHVADELGRPMAILRFGSRTPDSNTSFNQFAYGSPPLVRFPMSQESIPVVGELKSVRPSRRTVPASTARHMQTDQQPGEPVRSAENIQP